MKKLKFFFAIFLLIFLYACDDTNNQKAGKDTPFIGGQSGLSVQFLDDAPPSEVLTEGNFLLTLN